MSQFFRDESTADLFRERNSRAARRIPRDLWRVVQRKLKLLDAAARLDDLFVPADNRLELLKGDHAGRHSIRVNDQYRVTFRWERAMPTKSASRIITRDVNWLGPAIHPGELLEQVYFASRQVTRNPSVYPVKTNGDPTTLVTSVREILRGLDPALPIYDVRPLSAYVDDARALRQFTAMLTAFFAVAAALLTATGVALACWPL